MTITDSFINKVMSFSSEVITEETFHQIKRCLLDYCAVVHAGASETASCMASMQEIGSAGVCTIFGRNIKSDIYTAALINGFNSHVIELDDGHRFGMIHLEATVITAMIAVAQKVHLSLEQFLIGILAGYEATIRLARSIQPEHKKRGFHATGTCGSIGIACGIGCALNFSESQLKGAISAAATSASGLLEVIEDESQLKPFNVANAVESGIAAAFIGKSGFSGPKDILGGKRGFFQSFGADFKKEELFNFGGKPAIQEIYFKPYASCRHCHAPIECALNIKQKNKIDINQIENIEVQTYKLAILGHDHSFVTSTSAAKMSTPYSVAASMVLGTCGIQAFSKEALMNKDIMRLSKKVRITENSDLTNASPAKRGAIVVVKLLNGKTISNRVDYPLGEPENSISDEQLEEKYKSLMTYAHVPQKKQDEIKNIIWEIENRYADYLNL